MLDIGCGFGDTTQQIAGLVGPSGEAVGVDAAQNFIETPRSEAPDAGVANARFFVADVQTDPRRGPTTRPSPAWARCSSSARWRRCGTSASRSSPGGKLAWSSGAGARTTTGSIEAQQVVEGIVQRPEEYDEPTCGPGPFSMANADTVTDQLIAAGFEGISLRRCDLPIKGGNDLDQALEIVMSIGPAGEILRLLGDRAEHLPAAGRRRAARRVQGVPARGRHDLGHGLDLDRHRHNAGGSPDPKASLQRPLTKRARRRV